MRKILFVSMIMTVALFLVACGQTTTVDGTTFYDYSYTKEKTDDQFDFEGNYLPPELTVDGVMDEEEWLNHASSEITFGNELRAQVRFYRGDRALYAFFTVEDETLRVLSENGGDDVNKGDSIELYLNIRNDDATRPQSDDIQINIGINGKTRLLSAGDGSWGSWNGLIDFAINLEGTLDQGDDTDIGYTMEVMIPYAQIGMEKDDVIGIALGHVDKSGANNVALTDYRWEGFVYESEFVDPQNPSKYVIYDGTTFYKRGNEPLSPIAVDVTVVNQNDDIVTDAVVAIENTTLTGNTDASGMVMFEAVDRNNDLTLTVTKDGYFDYSKTWTVAELSELESLAVDVLLVDESIDIDTTLTGRVVNVYEGVMENATISVQTDETELTAQTDANGMFQLDVTVTQSMTLTVSKEGYEPMVYALTSDDVVPNGTSDLGDLEVLIPSQTFTFSGARDITGFDATVARGLDGFYWTFVSTMDFPDSAHIELFIDTDSSMNGRDTTDYRIDFNAVGTIGIVNFGEGDNTNVATSGITIDINESESLTTVLGFIPYTFLNVEPLDIIGISAGVWSGSDWDGFGFDGFVAPEFTDQYVRIGEDSYIYKYSNNNKTSLITGVVSSEGEPLEGASVNGRLTDENGIYVYRVERTDDVILTASNAGYVTDEVTLVTDDLTAKVIVDFDLEGDYLSSIMGNVGMADVKVYVESNPTSFVLSDENGDYQLFDVDTRIDQTLVFEKEGYLTYETILTSEDLQTQKPYTLDVTMSEEDHTVMVSGIVNSVYGPVEGALVSIGELNTLTNASGEYTLNDVLAETSIITVEKENFDTISVELLASSLEDDLIYDFEMLKEADDAQTFSGKSSAFTTASAHIQRGIEGFYFTFVGETAWRTSPTQNEVVELFIDTNTSGASRDTTDYLFMTRADGVLNGIVNWELGGNEDQSTIVVTKLDDMTLQLYIPYAFLDVDPLEVIGVSMGVWNEFESDWDGWAYDDLFVAPEIPTQYIRIDANNLLYRASNNETMAIYSGYVTVNEEPLANASVNGVLTDENGYYMLRLPLGETHTLTASKGAYTSVTTEVLAENQEVMTTMDFALEEDFYTTIQGNTGIAGVTVSVDDTALSAISDESGDYLIENVDVRIDQTLSFDKEGYVALPQSITASELQATRPYTLDVTMVAEDETVNISGTIVSYEGLLTGATVEIGALSQVTNAIGYFEFLDVAVMDLTLTATYADYDTTTLNITAVQLTEDLSLQVELLKPYDDAQTFSGKTSGENVFTLATAQIQRGYEGVYVSFVGTTPWQTEGENHEVVEFFVDTKTSGTSRDTTDYLFSIRANGTLKNIVNWEAGGNEDPTTIVVSKPDDYTLSIYIPYAFLDITSDEVFGISMGVWSEIAVDWDGWGFDGFVDPANPTVYIRVAADNTLYKATSNA